MESLNEEDGSPKGLIEHLGSVGLSAAKKAQEHIKEFKLGMIEAWNSDSSSTSGHNYDN